MKCNGSIEFPRKADQIIFGKEGQHGQDIVSQVKMQLQLDIIFKEEIYFRYSS